MIGLDLYTVHPDGALCNDTTGFYVRHGQWAGGVLKNSDCRIGAWGAWVAETNSLTTGTIKAKAAVMVGAIAGYRSADVLPLLVPSAGAQLGFVRHTCQKLHVLSLMAGTSQSNTTSDEVKP